MNPATLRSVWNRVRPLVLPIWLGFFTLLCVLGLNPYFRPDYHDNITYYVAAEAILAGEGYTFQGAPIADWPPVTSLVLAFVFAVFGTSIFAAKIISIAAAVISILLANRLLRLEGRPDRLKTIAVFTLVPAALLTATTVASDWICAAFSFGCLLTLWHLRESRSIKLAITTGLLLGSAALTRQTGVLLGAAIVAQAISLWRQRRSVRAVLPEALAAGIGAAMYLGWSAYTATRIADQPPLTGNYANEGLTLFTDFSFYDLALSIFDLFWKWDHALGKLGLSSTLAALLLIVPSAILVIGAVRTITKRPHASDFYALAFLALIFGYHWKMSRYLLPIAPFLIGWFFVGLRWISELPASVRLTHQQSRFLAPLSAALWIAFLVPLNAFVLFNKAGNGAHRGISTIANPLPGDYYESLWADLHAGCDAIVRDGHPGAVAASGFYIRYVKAFTGRPTTDVERAPDSPATYAVHIRDEDDTDPTTFARPGDTTIFESGAVTVFRRALPGGEWSQR